jgi:hypothetical protein
VTGCFRPCWLFTHLLATPAVAAVAGLQMMATGAGGGGGAGRSLLPATAQSNQRLCVFAFDLLVCEGDVLVDKPLIERRARLRRDFGPERGRFAFVDGEDIDAHSGGASAPDSSSAADPDQDHGGGGGGAPGDETGDDAEERAAAVASHVSALCRAAVNAGCEGLMVKSLEGPTAGYVPGARVATAWIKLKKDYLAEGLADTIDVVPIAVCNQSLSRARVSELFQHPQPTAAAHSSFTDSGLADATTGVQRPRAEGWLALSFPLCGLQRGDRAVRGPQQVHVWVH